MICQDCGTTDGVDYTVCPYADEINQEIVHITVCEGCYHERLMDI